MIDWVSDSSKAAGWKSGGWLEDRRRVDDREPALASSMGSRLSFLPCWFGIRWDEAVNCCERGGQDSGGRIVDAGGAEVARWGGTTSGLIHLELSLLCPVGCPWPKLPWLARPLMG